MSLKPPDSVTNDLDTNSVIDDIEVLQESPLNVMDNEFGALANGGSNPLSTRYHTLARAQDKYPFATSLSQEIDWAASQLLTNTLYSSTGISLGEGVWPGGDYRVTDSVIIPGTTLASETHQEVHFRGYNATIHTTASTPIFDRPVTLWGSVSNASAGANSVRPFFEGFRFYGSTPGSSQYGIRYTGSQNMAIRDCEFHSLDGGTDLVFCISPTVDNCLSHSNDVFAHRTRDAVTVLTEVGHTWTGGPTAAATSGTWPLYRKCRDVCSTGQFTSFWIETAYNGRIEQCISEGLSPNHNVYFVHNAVSRRLMIDGLHIENSPSVSCIFAPALNRVIVENLHLGTSSANRCIIDATGSSSGAEFHIETIPFWPTSGGNAFFRHGTATGNHYWFIKNVGTSAQDFTAAAMWDTTGASVQPDLINQRGIGTATETGGAGFPTERAKRVNLFATEEMRLSGGTTGTRVGNRISTATRCDRFGNAVPTPAADGIVTAFKIPHGLTDTAAVAQAPTWAEVKPRNQASAATHWISAVDTTDITITFAAAPATGLSFFWAAKR